MVTAETKPMHQCWCNVLLHVMKKSILRKKNLVLPIEKLPFLALARNTIMLKHLIIHFSLHYLSTKVVANKGKFQTYSSKSGCGCLLEVAAYKRFQIYIVIRLGNFWYMYFGKLVAEQRWLLMRGGRNQRFDCM